MIRRRVVLSVAVMAMLVFIAAPVLKAQEAPAQNPEQNVDPVKQALINSLTTLQNQEAKVIVLQQLLNREVGELRQVQVSFCEKYKLDVEKWRRGEYQYDVKENKFVEKPPAEAAPAETPPAGP